LAPEQDYYRLPIHQIKQAAGTSAKSVYALVRSFADSSRFIGETSISAPYLDLIGAGMLGRREKLPWLALLTNQPELLVRLLGKGASSAVDDLVASERIRMFSAIARHLRAWERNIKQGAGSNEESPLFSTETKNGQHVVILCSIGEANFVAPYFSSSATIIEIQSNPFLIHALKSISTLRTVFGAGWLPSADKMAKAAESAAKCTKVPPILTLSELGEIRAGIAMREMLLFGWLGSDLKETTRASGIHRYHFDGFPGWPDGLSIEGGQRLRLKKAETFESLHEDDRAFLAIKYKGACNDMDKFPASPLASCWFALPLIRPNGAAVILRLFGKIPIDVIAFEAGSSKASDAGVLERIVKLADPNRSAHRWELLNVLLRAVMPSLVGRGRLPHRHFCYSPLDLSCALELPNLDHETLEQFVPLDDQEAGKNSVAAVFALGVIRWLFKLGLRAGPPKFGVTMAVNNVMRRILRMSPVGVDLFGTIRDANSDKIYQEMSDHVGAIEDAVKEAVPQGTRCRAPVHKLAGAIAFLCGMAERKRLVVSDFLQTMIRKRFDLVLILPVDRPLPKPPSALRPYRSVLGSWNSHRMYDVLFGLDNEEGAIKVDLAPVLRAVRSALVCGSIETSPGWLGNKASETNELQTVLMMEVGLIGDFDLGCQLPSLAGKSDGELLKLLDPKLLVRCLLSTPGGKLHAERWVGRLAAQVNGAIVRKAQARRESDLKFSVGELPAAQVLRVFSDMEGILAAAFAAASRRKDQEDNVCFLVDNLAAYCLSPESNKTEKHESRIGDDHTNISAGGELMMKESMPDGIATKNPQVFLQRLMRQFESDSADAEKVAQTIDAATRSEEASHGDSLMEWLMEMEDLIDLEKNGDLNLVRKLDDIKSILRKRGLMG